MRTRNPHTTPPSSALGAARAKVPPRLGDADRATSTTSSTTTTTTRASAEAVSSFVGYYSHVLLLGALRRGLSGVSLGSSRLLPEAPLERGYSVLVGSGVSPVKAC